MAREIPKGEKKPTVAKALHAVSQEADVGKLDASRITIRLLASGQVTYRIHPSDGDFYVGGVAEVS